MGKAAAASSSSSSNENSNHVVPALSSSTSSFSLLKRDLTTDLRLGLSISASPSQQQNINNINPPRNREVEYYESSVSDWEWMKAREDDELMEGNEYDINIDNDHQMNMNSYSNQVLYVKVYMEGHPIGRKLNVMAHDGYQHLITTLDHMFNTNILWGADVDETHNCEDFHVLTYEDEEGDWMMVGDVPWEMFLSAVRRLKITKACPCC